jgi:glycosyltransferase involved in cell wall biosynthesis
MHVAFVNLPIEFYSPVSGGAISTVIAQTSRELVRAGHRVTVLTPVNDDPVYDAGDVVPVVHKRRDDLSFARRRLSRLRQLAGRWDWPFFEHFLASVTRQLPAIRPDAVVLHNDLYSSPHVRRAVPSATVAVWLHNEWRSHPANLARTLATTDRFLACSRYVADWTARAHGFPADRFAVVPNGVDLDAFRPRDRFDAPHAGPLKVLFIGRIDRNKGPDVAVDAAAALRAEGLDVRMTVAGGVWFYGNQDPMTDPFFRELHGKMQSADADYLGHVPRDRVPALVRDHDLVCVLSRSNEPFGLVALEAMASGCAVIASHRGGLPEACGGAAELVDPDDLLAVVAAMRRMATDPEHLAACKRRGVDRANRGSWSVTAERLVSSISPPLRGGSSDVSGTPAERGANGLALV